ncbi:MAG: transcriptional regulator [Thermosipho sp. (in: Bacteria)]|nr:transcriptional regulator [Thermosipho sp. (in: thermotogales)]
MEKILVPDALPNNLRAIRDMRGLTVKQVAEDLKIDRNFLSAVEMEKKNFSGKTTIRVLKYFNINFYKVYDVRDRRVLPVTDYVSKDIRPITLVFDLSEEEIKQYPSVEEVLRNVNINETAIMEQIQSNLKNRKLEGKVDGYTILHKEIVGNKMYLKVDLDYKELETREYEFDINFLENEDRRLTEMLKYRGFDDAINTIEEDVDGHKVRIEGDKVYLSQPFKIPKGDSVNDYYVTDVLDIEDVTVIEDTKKRKNRIKFKAITKELNNLKAVRTLTRLTIQEMHTALGLSYNGYVNLEQGNQKISSKVMWRLVKMLRVPLEVIINVDEYYERFCTHYKISKKKI